MNNRIALVDDPLFFEHRAREPHPERPERLQAARAAVAQAKLSSTRTELPPRDATDQELGRVHGGAYLEALGHASGQQGYFDADTFYGPKSVEAARRAAGGAIALVDALIGSEARFGAALLRPPGHHARPATAMGFCLLNNVAVAAAHARANGKERVAIIDWDVHHGNGTQEMFYADPSVLYVSLHQFPFYPGTGAAHEIGSGDGRGKTVNVPLSGGATDAVYVAAFDRLLAPILSEFDPDLVLISAGFDAHRRDPLASMALTENAYHAMTRRIARALPRGAAGRIGLVLEGGYDLEGLRSSLSATLEALDSDGPPDVAALGLPISPIHEAELDRAIRAQKAHWKLD
jgi:acetoin utilization deacetylase AcuC-like enzyme